MTLILRSFFTLYASMRFTKSRAGEKSGAALALSKIINSSLG
jgi:hypothetical protein